jgi:hypothetical protein
MLHYKQTTYKDTAEIKAAVDKGVRVFQHNSGYEVIKDSIGQYLIVWMKGTPQEHTIGLTWTDGVTLNGRAYHFYSLHKDDPANP